MCVCLQEPQVLEAQTRRGPAVMEGQVPREVSHVWWSSRLLRVKIKSYQISVGLFVLLTEKFYSFEHFFFFLERNVSCICRRSRPNICTSASQRKSYFGTLCGILLLFLLTLRKSVQPKTHFIIPVVWIMRRFRLLLLEVSDAIDCYLATNTGFI